MPCNLCMSYENIPIKQSPCCPITKKNSTKNFGWAPKLTEAKSYLKLVQVIEHFFLIGRVEYGVLALVVQALDRAIQQNDKSTIQRISTWKTNCTIHWIEIDPLDSTIQPLTNQGLVFINYYIAFRYQIIPFGGCIILLLLIKVVIIIYYLL